MKVWNKICQDTKSIDLKPLQPDSSGQGVGGLYRRSQIWVWVKTTSITIEGDNANKGSIPIALAPLRGSGCNFLEIEVWGEILFYYSSMTSTGTFA